MPPTKSFGIWEFPPEFSAPPAAAAAAAGYSMAENVVSGSSSSAPPPETPEVKKVSLGNCQGAGSVKSAGALVQSAQGFPAFEQDFKAFTDMVLEYNRYSTELMQKIQENAEIIAHLKITILRLFRKMVMMMGNVADDLQGIDKQDLPAVKKDEVSPEEIAEIKKKLLALLHKYKEHCVSYAELNKVAGEAQQDFYGKWRATTLKIINKGVGPSVAANRDWTGNIEAKNLEVLVLFGGEEKVRAKFMITQKIFTALVQQHKKEVIAAEKFHGAIVGKLEGNLKELNTGRALEAKLFEMEKKLELQLPLPKDTVLQKKDPPAPPPFHTNLSKDMKILEKEEIRRV